MAFWSKKPSTNAVQKEILEEVKEEWAEANPHLKKSLFDEKVKEITGKRESVMKIQKRLNPKEVQDICNITGVSPNELYGYEEEEEKEEEKKEVKKGWWRSWNNV